MGEHEIRSEAAASSGWARGEDRSDWQRGGEPWTGNRFGFTKFTEGTGFTDPTAAPNWAAMDREKLPRGGYHFFHPALSPIDQARHFVSVAHGLGLRPGDMLLADVEITVGADGGWSTAPHAYRRMDCPHLLAQAPPPPHVRVVDSSARLFLDTVSSLVDPKHNPVLVYTDGSIASTLHSCVGYGLFIAWYSGEPPEVVQPWDSPWLFWQAQAGGGAGGGDLDYFHDDGAGLDRWLVPYRGAAPQRPRLPALSSKSGDEMFYLPNGDGAEVAVDVPEAVPGRTGDGSPGFVSPGHLALNAQGASTVHVTWNTGEPGAETPEHLDWNRAPALVAVPHGARSVKLRRERGVHDSVVVTASWRP